MTPSELDRIYSERASVVASLAFTWQPTELDASIEHHIVIADAPSLVKDALSLGLLEGELERDGHCLRGDLSLTEDGRVLVQRCWADLRRSVQ
jgi:hypothetical protein